MAVEMDFVQDLVNHLRSELVAAGFAEAADTSKVPDDDVGIRYFNVQVRTIEARPRVVKRSKVYASTVPVGNEVGAEELLARVTRGDDLRLHQSRKLVRKKLAADDGMLNEWGIQHLHPSPAGSKHVLMCHVTPTTLFAIGYWPHDNWTSKPIWDALIDSWPGEFARYAGKDVEAPTLTDQQRADLRAKNVNVFLNGPDGKVYASMGGGLTTAGTNRAATAEYDRLFYRVQDIEEHFRQRAGALSINDPTRLTLKFKDDMPIAVLDEATGRRFNL